MTVRPDPLQLVRAAAQARRAAEQRYRWALHHARAEGHTAQAIAEAAGTTRQNVWQLTKKGTPQ